MAQTAGLLQGERAVLALIEVSVLPVVLVAAASFPAGAMVDVRRSGWWRPCAAIQVVVCLRAAIR